MENLKHTPGKWTVKFVTPDGEDDGESDVFIHAPNPKLHYGTEIMMDDFGEHNSYPREQKIADAKLIAAAPDMLKELCTTYEMLLAEMPNSWRHTVAGQARLAILVSTIAKATGLSVEEIQEHSNLKGPYNL